MDELEAFIVEAKANCYIGRAPKNDLSCRDGSHDLSFKKADFSYLDSYFGGTDFIGQEIIWHHGIPIWGMNCFGKILHDELLDAETAGRIITTSLQNLYRQGRFLGGFSHEIEGYRYHDQTEGSYRRFSGIEIISRDELSVYQLDYHGGMIRP
jgi:hypothetical protein